MSHSPSDSHPNEKDIFLSALEIDDRAERQAYLQEKCQGNPDLLRRIEKLLGAHDTDDNRLDPENFELSSERKAAIEELRGESRFIANLGKTIHHLGDYELLEEIGRGTMGVVFRARQISLNREVAIKVILGSVLASPANQQRFRIEAKAAANLQHPNIVPIFEIGQHEDHDYYSMAYVPGGTLKDKLATLGNDRRQAVELMLKVARAVQLAHERGILHRDLKPENILIDFNGEPLISDFGLVHHLDDDSALTLTGQILGTPRYMAPELADGQSKLITTSADVFSLGAILYEILAGSPAFKGDTLFQTLKQLKETQPAPLRSYNSQIDIDLDTIVTKCIEKQPKDRYRSARALADDLEAWLENRPISARAPSTTERVIKWVKRRPIHAGLLGSLALLLFALGVGGPVAAYQQAQLRQQAEQARAAADLERQRAINARLLAENQALANQSLAYDYGTRLAAESISTTFDRFSLAPHAILRALSPRENQEDQRDWEWYFLNGEVYLAPIKHGKWKGAVTALSFSPNGEYLVSSKENNKGSQLRNSLHSAVINVLHDKSGSHVQMDWNAPGNRLATVSSSNVVKVWDIPSTKLLTKLPVPAVSVSWKKDEALLTSVDSDGVLRIWDLSDSQNAKEISQHPLQTANIQKIAWSPDGLHLAAINGSKHAFVWKANALDASPQTLKAHPAPLFDLAWHPDSHWLATAGRGTLIRIWEIPSGSRLVKLDGRGEGEGLGDITAMAWDPHGFRMLYARGETLKLFDAAASAVEIVQKHDANIIHLAWNAKYQTFALGDDKHRMQFHRIGLPPAKQILKSGPKPFHSVRWSANQTYLSFLRAHRKLIIIPTIGNHKSLIFEQPEGRLIWYDWHPQDLKLFFIIENSEGTHLYTFDPRTEQNSLQFSFSGNNLTAISLSPDGQQIATSDEANETAIWDLDTGEAVRYLSQPNKQKHPPYQHLSWSPDGSTLCGSIDSQQTTLWNTERGQIRFKSKISDPPLGDQTTHAWHPEGTVIAQLGPEGQVIARDLKKDQSLPAITQHAPFRALAWHPNGTRYATGGADNIIRIWDWKHGETTLHLEGHQGPITSLAWSLDGMRLASTSEDGTLRIWDATAGYLVEGRLPDPEYIPTHRITLE